VTDEILVELRAMSGFLGRIADEFDRRRSDRQVEPRTIEPRAAPVFVRPAPDDSPLRAQLEEFLSGVGDTSIPHIIGALPQFQRMPANQGDKMRISQTMKCLGWIKYRQTKAQTEPGMPSKERWRRPMAF
jgi:hypothetical protein